MSAVWASAKIVEVDFAGIEQVVMGWCMNDPRYIRIAKLGTHALVASQVLATDHPQTWQVADLAWPEAQLVAYLKSIKKGKDAYVQQAYECSKRCVHGTAYGLTTFGMARNYPLVFPSVKRAEAIQASYFALAPGVPTFHTAVRHTAHLQHYLGGAAAYAYDPDARKVIGHPYQYQHWFWSVVAYERLSTGQYLWRSKRGMPLIELLPGQWYGVTLGEDAKRAVAYLPQSIARGVQTDAAEKLFDPASPDADQCYIGDVYFGRTPLRAPIHDSFLMEVPTRMVDRVLERSARAMCAPILRLPCPQEWGLGPALTIGVDAKVGPDWGSLAPVEMPSYHVEDVEVAADVPYSPAEETDEEEVAALETRIA